MTTDPTTGSLDSMVMAGKEAPSEAAAGIRAAHALLSGAPNPANYRNLPLPTVLADCKLPGVYVSKFSWSVCPLPLRPTTVTATVPTMQQPAWPHPMRDTETDAAQAVAASLGWDADLWLWE